MLTWMCRLEAADAQNMLFRLIFNFFGRRRHNGADDRRLASRAFNI
jgi:hypothetical protein